ncbi:efflux RND transporter permease subunit [Fuerstiella marisgermanici]|uniref:Efflux transporter, putative, hydrophobe/amphiphile efflux-3 (HAE3) family n=1 Tax=Fuerstiella marisgermanici TaxID=1891926 RepID=A0A1P8WMM2_9PLAN|nr:MMPL family transporter [Fuerstiella marisgermanici]APZ95304.1 efflux transporter, putative, hydrophobe/amphiphile efflux-3 (HAE3) family [Fuerstiella marisgermanici]
MVSQFYRRHSANILLCCLIALPILIACGEQVVSNNDIETWLPRNSQVRTDYDNFVRTFGADETILVAFPKPFPAPARLEAAAGRMAGLDGVSSCWTRQQLLETMLANEVSEETAKSRLVHLMATPDNDLETMLVSLNKHGTANRSQVCEDVRRQLAYCQMPDAVLAGGPIVGTQLDKLGSRKRAAALFMLTMAICLVLLYLNISCWKTSGALMLANLLCINLTMTTIWLSGYEMNFIMSSLPVMVMVFTTASAIHFIGHFRHEYPRADAVERAIRGVIRPSAFATVTTVIGLVSLAVSDIGPIPAFGAAAALGTVYSFFVGIFLTPAIIVGLKYRPPQNQSTEVRLERTAMYIVNRPIRVLVPGLLLTAFCAVGVFQLRSLISPLDFLPSNDPVLRDTLLIQNTLTSPTSIEAVVDFGSHGSSFVDRLREVREIESRLSEVDNICHTLSLADFFPEELSENTLSLSKLAAASNSNGGVSGLMADGSRLWRVSLRLHDDEPSAVAATMASLKACELDRQITFTGLGPLLEIAQGQIFDGFWKSFASAFVLITLVMVLALRSITAGLVAMIPNLTPIILVFGTLGLCDYAIDIGIMMTASIALGLAVDGTFHFLFSYRDCRKTSGCRYRAVRKAILQTGLPIISSALISGTGLLALGFSPFKPTMRFGVLMFCLLLAALIGDLVLLPAFLAIGSRRKRLAAEATNAHDAVRRAA